MKAKTITTCKKDGNYPHVSQKSNKISKSTAVRATNEMASLAISSLTSQNDFCKNEEYSMDLDNKGDMGQTDISFNGCTDSMGQTEISFSGCTDSVVARDSLSSFLSSDSEAISPYNGPNYDQCQQFETETLIHSSMEQCDGADFTFKMITDRERTVYVRKRPFLQEFLAKVSEMFEIIIFTASKRMYAETLLDVLDPDKKFFSRRVCRESCTWKDRCCVKDLTVLGIDLAKVCIIDNTPEVFRFQVNNGIPIKSWYDDPTDSALMSLLPFLEKLVDVEDVRPLIAEKFGART